MRGSTAEEILYGHLSPRTGLLTQKDLVDSAELRQRVLKEEGSITRHWGPYQNARAFFMDLSHHFETGEVTCQTAINRNAGYVAFEIRGETPLLPTDSDEVNRKRELGFTEDDPATVILSIPDIEAGHLTEIRDSDDPVLLVDDRALNWIDALNFFGQRFGGRK